MTFWCKKVTFWQKKSHLFCPTLQIFKKMIGQIVCVLAGSGAVIGLSTVSKGLKLAVGPGKAKYHYEETPFDKRAFVTRPLIGASLMFLVPPAMLLSKMGIIDPENVLFSMESKK
jgi:hypothetical protein